MTPGEPSPGSLEDAVALAARAHDGQRDRTGAPYILHVLRVMLRMQTPEEMTAAVLHDAVEDSRLRLDELRRRGFPPRVVEAVEALSEKPGESFWERVDAVARDPLARTIKVVDLEDNIGMILAADQEATEDLERFREAHARLSG